MKRKVTYEVESDVGCGLGRGRRSKSRRLLDRLSRRSPWQAPLQYTCRANVAHVRQSRPDSGLGSKATALDTLQIVPILPESAFGAPLLQASSATCQEKVNGKSHRCKREFFIDNLLVRIHLNHRDDFSGPALRHRSLTFLFQVALCLPAIYLAA